MCREILVHCFFHVLKRATLLFTFAEKLITFIDDCAFQRHIDLYGVQTLSPLFLTRKLLPHTHFMIVWKAVYDKKKIG